MSGKLDAVPKSADTKKEPTVLLTVQRALAFLEAVATAERPPKLKDVSAQLGINITTAYHLMNTLKHSGYLVREADGTLRVGARASLLHRGMLRHFVLGRDLRPVVVSAPAARFDASRDSLTAAVREAAREISMLLGHIQRTA